MRGMILLVILLCASPIRAADQVDYALFGVATALHVIDLGQSLGIRHHAGYSETNPLLGSHPSDEALYAYALAVIGVDFFVVRYLSPEWRRLYLAFDIGQVAQATTMNARIGLKVHF